MASDFTEMPKFLATREGNAYEAQFSTSDYGAVGSQRPYQVVMPGYPAPKFLSQFAYLDDALRECGTLCQLTGKPFRLVKWGARLPCYPCRKPKNSNRLPGLRGASRSRCVRSPGALEGFPDAQPIADFSPTGGRVVYGPSGQPTLVGAPNFRVCRTPTPPSDFVNFKAPILQRYEEAVKTAQYIANDTGQNAYLCSSMGAKCRSRNSKKWVPVVYVSPGGLVKRYPQDMQLPPGVNSAPGSQTVVNPVSQNEFRELVRQSVGRTRLGQGH